MNSNGLLRKRWFDISSHFALDALLFYLATAAGLWLQFREDFRVVMMVYWPFILCGSFVLSSGTYIFGLYSLHRASDGIARRLGALFVCVGAAVALLIAVPYLIFYHPLGRGAVLRSAAVSYLCIAAHHLALLYGLRNNRERVAYIISCHFDELETRLFRSFGSKQMELAGVVEHSGYEAQGDVRVLGKSANLAKIVREERITRVLCTNKGLRDNSLLKGFCQLRYSGVTVVPLISLCEEVDQYVPLELLTSEWLLNASGEPALLYIKKVKRLFDVVVSLIGLVFASPLLLLGMALVKLTSPGPVFYRQTRSGRFGRQFHITKLRTMRVDAEKNGAVWSGKNDDRVTPVGRYLRKYRIDEIPQFFHVLMGDMSFVGPRPERPEIIEMLATEVPYYQERLMVQPGITGWAQVNYPYGSSVEDARRKLEYDLYYMKHMGLGLDLFILLDTVRIVLCGGASGTGIHSAKRTQAMSDFSRLSTDAAEVQKQPLGLSPT